MSLATQSYINISRKPHRNLEPTASDKSWQSILALTEKRFPCQIPKGGLVALLKPHFSKENGCIYPAGTRFRVVEACGSNRQICRIRHGRNSAPTEIGTKLLYYDNLKCCAFRKFKFSACLTRKRRNAIFAVDRGYAARKVLLNKQEARNHEMDGKFLEEFNDVSNIVDVQHALPFHNPIVRHGVLNLHWNTAREEWVSALSRDTNTVYIALDVLHFIETVKFARGVALYMEEQSISGLYPVVIGPFTEKLGVLAQATLRAGVRISTLTFDAYADNVAVIKSRAARDLPIF